MNKTFADISKYVFCKEIIEFELNIRFCPIGLIDNMSLFVPLLQKENFDSLLIIVCQNTGICVDLFSCLSPCSWQIHLDNCNIRGHFNIKRRLTDVGIRLIETGPSRDRLMCIIGILVYFPVSSAHHCYVEKWWDLLILLQRDSILLFPCAGWEWLLHVSFDPSLSLSQSHYIQHVLVEWE